MIGVGDGTFTTGFYLDAGGVNFGSVLTGDFNGDGILDLATTDVSNPKLIIFLGNTDESFTAQPPIGLSSISFLSGIADFNRDGIPDLFTSDTILLGKGEGTFTAMPGPGSSLNATGDFNGDAIPDLLSPNANGPDFLAQVFIGHGDGTFTALPFVQYPGDPVSVPPIAVADLNGDGLSDAVIGVFDSNNGGAVDVFRAGYPSTASLNVTFPPGSTHRVAASYSGDSNYPASSSQPVQLTVPPATATPVFIPKPGIYEWTQQVVITDATPGASIYFTLDGSTPTLGSPNYNGTTPITIGWEGTIKAFAVAPNAPPSPVVTATYTIDRPLPAPTFSLSPGTYAPPRSLTLTDDPSYCSHADCLIYYTLDGTAPTANSTKYSGPISLTKAGQVTVKALAISHHFMPSAVAAATYTLK